MEDHQADRRQHGDGPVGREEDDQRQRELHERAEDVGEEERQPAGHHVFRRVAVEPVTERLEPVDGRVVQHRLHRRGEVHADLGQEGAPPDREHRDLGDDDHVHGAAGHRGQRTEAEQDDGVLLGSRGQEGDLVAQPQEDLQDDVGDERPGRHQSGFAVRGCGLLAGMDQAQGEHGHHRDVQRDIDRLALVALGEGNLVGPGRQPQRAGADPVAVRRGHRHELEGQRPPGLVVAGGRPQDDPQHGLLQDDQLAPPGAQVPQRQARRGDSDDQPATDEEEQPLHQIDGVEDLRSTESVIDPVLGQQLHPGHRGHRSELGRINGR